MNVPRFRTTLALVIAPSAPALLFTFFVVLGALIGYRITLFAGLQLLFAAPVAQMDWLGDLCGGRRGIGRGCSRSSRK